MARAYARLLATVWADADFVSRTHDAQWAYFMVLSQSNLSYAGVVAYTPQRWAAYSPTMSIPKVRKAVTELAGHRFILLDLDTEELMVRSFLRHDGALGNPNVLKAAARDWRTILSPTLRDAVLAEVPPGQRDPFGSPPEGLPQALPDEHRKGSPNGSRASTHTSPTPSPSTSPSPSTHRGSKAQRSSSGANGAAPAGAGCVPDDAAFSVFFDRWPEARRAREPRARKAWLAARAEVGAEALLDAQRAWLAYWAREQLAERYIPLPATWLADRDWARTPPAPAAGKGARKDQKLANVAGRFLAGENGATS